MPRGYWRIILTVVGGLAALGIITVAGLYSYHQFYEPAEYQYPTERYEPARDATQPVASKDHPNAKAYDPHCQQPQQYNDADLCAQWGAVRAVEETNRLTRVGIKLAAVGFWIAFLGGLFGVIGTAFLVATFHQNRRSADAAHDANRPWIEIKITPKTFSISAQGAILDIDVRATNRGNSPASNMLVLARVFLVSREERLQPDVARDAMLAMFSRLKKSESTYGNAVFPGRRHREGHPAIADPGQFQRARAREQEQEEDERPLLVVGVRYRYSGRTFYTFETYTVGLPRYARNLKGDMTVHANEFFLVQHPKSYIT